ncbi:MAG: DUF2157 domain-containing protein [Patescibacteria group bacterium]
MFTSAKQALEFWVKEGLLTTKKARELEDALEGKAAGVPHRAIGIFSAVGAILIGLGVILFVASNWSDMTPVVKVALLIIGMLTTGWVGYYLSYERKDYKITGLALLFVNVLIFGASIFLVAQIYNLPLTFWWGALLWFLGAAFLAYVLQSRLHLWLSVPLFLLFIGWLRTYGVTGFGAEFNFFTGDSNVVALLPPLGAGMVSLGILHRKHPAMRFGEETLFHWGLFLVLLMIVISTADKLAFYTLFRMPTDAVSTAVALGSSIAFLAALIFGSYVTDQGRWGLLALGVYVAFVHILAQVPQWMGIPLRGGWFDGGYATLPQMFTGLFVVHVVLVFVLLLTIVWYGTILRVPGVINLGMLGLAATILIQYVSWAFEMFDRSIAFILGGVLILSLSAILERKRRQLVSSFR